MGQNATNDKIYGIDLGTTNSCISVLKDGRPRVIPVDGSGIMPSVVSMDGKELLVGRRARNRATAFPEESVRSVKRLMGTSEKISLGNRTYEPEDISAMILRRLCDEAERIEGSRVERVVITVPAYFSDAQRRATIEAGKRAGLVVERIVNEPTAAALFYDLIRAEADGGPHGESAKKTQPSWKHALVYDLGGGTFDVSVLRMGEIIEVLASTGDTHLGGDDFDERLARRLLDAIREREGADLSEHVPALARLRAVAESARIVLSEKASVLIEEAGIPAPGGKSCTISMEVSREELESMTGDLIGRTVASVDRALKEAGLTADRIDRVLPVGGMTRMPAIAARLGDIFGDARMPVVDPDLSVANGAAVQGAIISGENVEQILIDVTPHTLGLESLDPEDGDLVCTPIIPRNTPIPVTRSRTFLTVAWHQEQVELNVYQGESVDPGENTLIGSTSLALARAPEHSPITVEYSYDLNGMVRIIAEQKGYSRRTELKLDSRSPQLFASQTLNGLGDSREDDAEVGGAAINFVTRRARGLIDRLPPGKRRDRIADLLARYEKALRGEEEDVDEIEDELLSLMEEPETQEPEAKEPEAKKPGMKKRGTKKPEDASSGSEDA